MEITEEKDTSIYSEGIAGKLMMHILKKEMVQASIMMGELSNHNIADLEESARDLIFLCKIHSHQAY